MSGVERAIVMEDLQEQKEASKIVLDIQDTRRYFESQGGDAKSSKIAEGQVRSKAWCQCGWLVFKTKTHSHGCL